MKQDLFEDIVDLLPKCNYISDLHSMVESHNLSELIYVLEKINPNDYALNQWNELWRYLTTHDCRFQDCQKAYISLIDLLKNKH